MIGVAGSLIEQPHISSPIVTTAPPMNPLAESSTPTIQLPDPATALSVSFESLESGQNPGLPLKAWEELQGLLGKFDKFPAWQSKEGRCMQTVAGKKKKSRWPSKETGHDAMNPRRSMISALEWRPPPWFVLPVRGTVAAANDEEARMA